MLNSNASITSAASAGSVRASASHASGGDGIVLLQQQFVGSKQ